FKQLLRDDPAKLIPFLNALARISDAEMRCERHRLEMERLKTGLNPTAAPEKAPGLSPETRQRLEQELNLM
ncbi:MAG TPA: hypothetical protein VNT26_24125, partial [Candidatus Sulfotelmatobacter sp.]|nr:hypothetical protein [Candidatus Sulfotelmatobacter sp.]